MLRIKFIESKYPCLDYHPFMIKISIYYFDLGVIVYPDFIRLMLGFWHVCIRIERGK